MNNLGHISDAKDVVTLEYLQGRYADGKGANPYINLAYLNDNLRGRNGGIAPLDDNGKVPMSNIPDTILGQVVFGGTVNFANNTLTATIREELKRKLSTTASTIVIKNSATGDYGYQQLDAVFFLADNAFTFAGMTFDVGDWLISIGTAWKKIDNTDAVTSVNGKIGAVTLTLTDILGNTKIADSFIASAATWNAKQDAITEQNKLAWSLLSGVPNLVNTFGTKTGDITLRSGSTTRGDVNFSMSNNELRGVVVLADWAKAENRPAYKYGDSDLTGFGSAATKNTDYFFAAASFTANNIVSMLGDTAVNRATGDASGNNIASTYATKTQLTDGSVTKVGTADVGSATQPIYLKDGVPTAGNTVVDIISTQTVTGQKNFNTASNTNPVIISRGGNSTAECLSIGVDDNHARFLHIQDETVASYEFRGQWSDTESGGGSKAGSAYMRVNLGADNVSIDLNGNTVYHAGNANKTDVDWSAKNLSAAGTLKIGKATLTWDESHQCIIIDKGFASDSFISAGGINTESGGGGSDYPRLDTWAAWNNWSASDKAAGVLSAKLGVDLDGRVKTLESRPVVPDGVLTTSNYATTLDNAYVKKSAVTGGGSTWGSSITVDGKTLSIPSKPTYAFVDLTAHPTTLSGYGITDAKIANGVITLGSNTITPWHTGNFTPSDKQDVNKIQTTITNSTTNYPSSSAVINYVAANAPTKTGGGATGNWDITSKNIAEVESTIVEEQFGEKVLTEANEVMEVKELKGNTVVWNQAVKDNSPSGKYAEITKNGDWYNVKVSTQSSKHDCGIEFSKNNLPSGHTVLICFDAYSVGDSFSIAVKPNNVWSGTYGKNVTLNTTSEKYCVLFTPSSLTGVLFIGQYNNTNAFEFNITRPQLYDLTQMFGAGNEPATPEDFFRLFPAARDNAMAYNEGELVNFTADAIAYKNEPMDESGKRKIAVTELRSKGGELIFPDGMKKAGSVCDEIMGRKAIKRIGVVDLGSYTWTKQGTLDSSIYRFRTANRIEGALIKSAQYKSNIVCVLYPIVKSANDTYFAPNIDGIALDEGMACIVDNKQSGNTVEQFRASLQGVMLLYELATPIEYDLPDDIEIELPALQGSTISLEKDDMDASERAKYGVVDMGSLNWSRANTAVSEVYRFGTKDIAVSGMKLLVAGFTSENTWNAVNDNIYSISSDGTLYFLIKECTTREQFVSKVRSTKLYYELAAGATPVTAPLNATVAYRTNSRKSVRDILGSMDNWYVRTYGNQTIYGDKVFGNDVEVKGVLKGNAATATKFNSVRTIALTGNVTGSVSSDGANGWSIVTTISQGAVTNGMLANSSMTIAGNAVSLGSSITADTIVKAATSSATFAGNAATATNASQLGGIVAANYWHNGNAGTTAYDWKAKALTLAGAITGATTGTFSGKVTAGSLQIGNITLSTDTDGNLKIDGNAYTTGFLSAGGINTERQSRGFVTETFTTTAGVWKELNNATGSTNVCVSLYKGNALVYAEVEVTTTKIRVKTEQSQTLKAVIVSID